MIVEQKLKDIQARAAEIETQMNSGEVSGDELTKLSKEYSRLNEILPLINEYFQTTQGIADAAEMEHDPELHAIAVAHDDAAIYQIVVDLGGIGHLGQEEVGIRRINLFADRQFEERLHKSCALLQQYLHCLIHLEGVFQHHHSLLLCQLVYVIRIFYLVIDGNYLL